MKNTTRTVSMTAFGALTIIGLTAVAMPASAATGSNGPVKNDQGQCLIGTVHHEEVSHQVPVITPGTDAVTHEEQRWSREVPGVAEVNHQETQFYRVIPGLEQVTHDEWYYSRFVEGTEEQAHYLNQFSRTNPGHTQTFTDFYKYKQVIPAQSGTKEYNWKISVDDYKVKYQYQKQVKGVVQVKTQYGWQNTGATFDWEWWSSPSYQWSFTDTSVLESGGHNSVQSEWTENGKQYRKVTQAYQYTKNGVTEQVKTGSHWTYQWGVNSPGNGWVKTGEERWLAGQEPKPEQTILYQDGAWVAGNPGTPWTQYDHKSEGNNDAVAPFQEWRAQDGSATPDVNQAGKFEDTSFPDWNSYGTPEKVVTHEATEDETFYLTRDVEGNLGESTDPEDAAKFSSTDPLTAVDTTKWTEFGRKTVTDQEATPDKTVYLTEIAEGAIGETEDPEQASWVLPDDPNVDLTIWQQMVNEHGDPLIRTVVDQEAIPASIEYYVPGGEPTRELGDSNWTTDEPEGWAFVDDREVTDKEAIPGTITYTKVVDQAAWDEDKYGACGLAMTGANDPWGPSGLGTIGTGILLAGVAAVGATAISRRRARHLADAGMTSS